MFVINADQSIYLTRGDIAVISVSAKVEDTDTEYTFKPGDIIRFKVYTKGRPEDVVLVKDVLIDEETITVDIQIENADSELGELISKPKDYWYEVEMNPDTLPQTIIGYDVNGPKIFRLFPEGDD